MITSDNFCHIEQVADGVKVLFWVEFDGDDAIVHQIVSLEIGTLDIKVTMPSDRVETLWPDSFRFSEAAAKVLSTAEGLGFARRVATSPKGCADV
ncbi:hypothetical protein [Shinella zoogloeoides]|uniref:Uncharacterized protein n=1 Tax=Shinella zoogloeoides TaxID=352475 RepID=A0A6N8T872_SHIZO|nr:hypothetical protein [Shinella zoogloeoides]MXN99416.1 hypothetical protein [Shinella zoogloeoides]UEX82805.1 hypothetical protein K8M09_05865 [Shinella zoogloeoides]